MVFACPKDVVCVQVVVTGRVDVLLVQLFRWHVLGHKLCVRGIVILSVMHLRGDRG